MAADIQLSASSSAAAASPLNTGSSPIATATVTKVASGVSRSHNLSREVMVAVGMGFLGVLYLG